MEYITEIIKDTLPEQYHGVGYNILFGSAFGFSIDKAIPTDLYFNPEVSCLILEPDTKKVLFQFTTRTILKCDKREPEDGFYELVNSLLLKAIDGFNGKFKIKKSGLTFGKSYTPMPTIEKIKAHIRTAYFLVGINESSAN